MHRYDDPLYVRMWNDWLGLFQNSDIVDKVVGVFIGLVVAGIVAAALYGIFRLVDQVGTPKRSGAGRILGKWIREGYWGSEPYTAYGMHWEGGKYTAGPYTASRPKWVPPQPQVKVALAENGAENTFDVDDGAYADAKEQAQVLVTYQKGRLSGSTYLRSYMQAT